MKRWLPYVLVALGIAGLIAGWLLYPAVDADGARCSVQVLYRNYIQGSGEIGNGSGPCADGTFQLYASLSLLAAGALLLLGGWAWAAPRHAARLTTRVPAQAVAWSLLIALILVGTGGWFGWRAYGHHRDTQRFHQAEAALARLELPAGITALPNQQFCVGSRDQRCGHTLLPMKQVEQELATLLHGHRQNYFCAKGRTPVSCFLNLKGTLAGYPVFASVSPATYEGKQHPPGAQQVRFGTRTLNSYVYGSQVSIVVISPEDMRA